MRHSKTSGTDLGPIAAPPPRPPTTLREALLAEAIGDLGRLLERLDALTPAMDASRRKMADTAAVLARQVDMFRGQMAEVSQQAQRGAVEYIAARTKALAIHSQEEQTQAMTTAARRLFDGEVRPTLQRLTGALQAIVERSQRPWDLWLTHAATAAASSIVTLGLTLYILHR